MKQCSLITVVNKENAHLANLLHGLLISSHTPAEIILVDTGNNIDLPEVTPVGVIKVELDSSSENISLAAARIAGAKVARYDHLIFLDSDCIPSATFVENMLEIIQHTDGLIMGQPQLLASDIANHFTEHDLIDTSTEHPDFPAVKLAFQKEDDYSLFRSICFGVSSKTFEELQDFDNSDKETELTDSEISHRARKMKLPFYRANTIVYQQTNHVYSHQ